VPWWGERLREGVVRWAHCVAHSVRVRAGARAGNESTERTSEIVLVLTNFGKGLHICGTFVPQSGKSFRGHFLLTCAF
jgi:hypothetical protein